MLISSAFLSIRSKSTSAVRCERPGHNHPPRPSICCSGQRIPCGQDGHRCPSSRHARANYGTPQIPPSNLPGRLIKAAYKSIWRGLWLAKLPSTQVLPARPVSGRSGRDPRGRPEPGQARPPPGYGSFLGGCPNRGPSPDASPCVRSSKAISVSLPVWKS